MVKYFKWNVVFTAHTVLRFCENSVVQVKNFDTNVVAVKGSESEIVALVSEQPVEIELTEIDKGEFIAQATLSSQAQFRLKNLANLFKKQCDELTGGVSVDEALSWKKQEERAREFLADTSKSCPQLAVLCSNRGKGETEEELALKIVTNADNYEVAYLTILGKYQSARAEVFEISDALEM